MSDDNQIPTLRTFTPEGEGTIRLIVETITVTEAALWTPDPATGDLVPSQGIWITLALADSPESPGCPVKFLVPLADIEPFINMLRVGAGQAWARAAQGGPGLPEAPGPPQL